MIIPSCLYYTMGEVSYNWIGTDGFEVNSETERFTVVCPRCRLNLVISRSSFDECGEEMYKNTCCTSRSFWFFQPMILLLFGVVVAVAVVVS